MSLELLRKLQKLALFFLILFLPLNSIPIRFAIPGIGGDLSNYFFILGMMLLAYEYWKFGFNIERNAKIFFVTYIGWQVICLAHGLLSYEYNELLTLEQIPKLEFILSKLASYGINIEELIAIKAWLFLRFCKNIILLNNGVFLLCFYVYHLYKNDFTSAFNYVRNAIVCLFILMGSYSVIELAWLKFDLQIAKNILITINPYLYDPVSSHGWWPPLLWKNQLRSVFTEPSFFGIVSVLSLPLIWSLLFDKQYKKLSLFVVFYYTLMIAATNARTAIVLTIVELFLLCIFNIIIRKKDYLRSSCLIVLVSVLAFGINLINFNSILRNSAITIKNVNIQTKSDSNIINKAVKRYVTRNITSVANTSSRSNNARFANLVANLNTVAQYPIMGVGAGLKDAYIDRNLPKFAYKNREVLNWRKYMQNKGVLKSDYPALNNYANIAVQNGLVGLLLYLSVVGYLVVQLLKYNKFIFSDYSATMLVIAMIGLLGAGFSSAYFTICNGIVWGLLYCKLKEIKNNDLS